ncbi:MAG: hypothetical protein EBU08_00940 [Micrococcales bacterium]|nr:hypothetical protein [Micrococcales bacterium]
MSNYTKSTDFASKDALASGNAAKIVKGTEIDTEFNNIATAIATKANLASPGFSGTPTAPTPSSGDSTTKLATTAFVSSALSTGIAAAYPVGSIYINASVATNPGTLLGFGTWTAFGAGKVLIGLDSSDALFSTAGNSSGSKDSIVVSHTHSATASSHDHSFTVIATAGADAGSGALVGGTSNAANDGSYTGTTGGTAPSVTVSSAGSSGTNANLQPYIVVYMWRRTA